MHQSGLLLLSRSWLILVVVFAVFANSCSSKSNSIPDAPKPQEGKKAPIKNSADERLVDPKPAGPKASNKNSEEDALAEMRISGLKKILELHEKLSQRSIVDIFENAVANIQVDSVKNLKSEIEKAFTKINLSNSSKATTIANIIYDNEIHAYSGTSLFFAVALKLLSNSQWKDAQIVVIYTTLNGIEHVLPGFIIQNTDTERLFGIEMLSENQELIDFGNTKDISQNMRVINALAWIDFESSPTAQQTAERAYEIVKETHEQFKIPLHPQAAKFESRDVTAGNRSTFLFGKQGSFFNSSRAYRTKLTDYGYSYSRDQNEFELRRQNGSGAAIGQELSQRDLEDSNRRMRSTNTCERAAEVFTRGKWRSVSFEISSVYSLRDKSKRLNDSTTEANIKERNKQFVFSNPVFSHGDEKKRLRLNGVSSDGKTKSIEFQISKKQNGSCILRSEKKSSGDPAISAITSGSLEITIPMSSAKSTEQDYSFYFEQTSEDLLGVGEFVFRK